MIEYIKSPPSEEDYRRMIELLSVEPAEMLHSGSFEKLGRSISQISDNDALVELLLEHPEVMNRPICIRGDQAVIARPSELVEQILD